MAVAEDTEEHFEDAQTGLEEHAIGNEEQPIEVADAEIHAHSFPALDFISFASTPFPCYASTGTAFHSNNWINNASITPMADLKPSPALKEGNLFRNAQWSPDGSCILSNTNDNLLRLYSLYLLFGNLACHLVGPSLTLLSLVS